MGSVTCQTKKNDISLLGHLTVGGRLIVKCSQILGLRLKIWSRAQKKLKTHFRPRATAHNKIWVNVILHVKVLSNNKQENSCLHFEFTFTWRITLEKRKVPILTQILLWGVALGLKWKWVNFGDFYRSKNFDFCSLTFRKIYYERHCT